MQAILGFHIKHILMRLLYIYLSRLSISMYGVTHDVTFCLSCSRTEKKEFLLDSKLCRVEDIMKSMQPIDRAVLGYMCKDIIDAGRLMWMKAQGLKSDLVKYVPITISPENRVLIAK